MNNYCVLCQTWEETESGFGCRKDGYSLHIDNIQRENFIKSYFDSCPKEVPYEYSRPDGKPYWTIVDLEMFKKIESSKFGIRMSGKAPVHNKVAVLIEEIKGLIKTKHMTDEFVSTFAEQRIAKIIGE